MKQTLETVACGRKRSFAGMLAAALLLVLIVGAAMPLHAQTFTILHNFNYATGDGVYSVAGLVRDQAGNLYGTARNGGAFGEGVVFKIDTSGTETLVHNFTGADGAYPYGGLILDSAGNLYGTTAFGGAFGYGTVFEIDTAGNETVLYSFDYTDGAYPFAGLVRNAAGNLYGTTVYGGASGYGTVFKIDTSANGTVLLSFNGTDQGASPFAGLTLDSAGNLYGATYQGGDFGFGTVFKLDSSGNETVLHSFDYSDGANPYSAVALDSAGNIYGTTFDGGDSGYGTVFKIDSSGTETVVHNFEPSDGGDLYAGVTLDSSGNLYGITYEGGDSGAGIVYKIDPSGTETVLHNLSSSDGGNSYGTLALDSSGNLYGTTYSGGLYGYGTAFEIIQTIPFSAFSAKLEFTSGFQLQGDFALGAGASAIDPTTQGLTLGIGTYSVTIPSGAFQQAKQGWFDFDGTIDGVNLRIRITPAGGNTYHIRAHASGVDLGSSSDPVTVKLTIGNNSGTTEVNAH